MRLLHGSTILLDASSSVATPPSRRANKELLTDYHVASTWYNDNTSDKEDADIGILLLSPTIISSNCHTNIAVAKSSVSHSATRSLLLLTTATLLTTRTSVAKQCSTNIVDCVNGNVRGTANTTCAAACGSSCCIGVNACSNFTGKLCKDGSCTGKLACTYASIPSVTDSCKGDYACYNTGYDGSVGHISTSCHGIYSCCYLGSYGAAGDIQDSCTSYQACDSVAYNGYIGHLASSCNNAYACQGAGSPTNGTGTIPYDLKNCCNKADSICYEANKDTLPTECWSDTKVRTSRSCSVM